LSVGCFGYAGNKFARGHAAAIGCRYGKALHLQRSNDACSASCPLAMMASSLVSPPEMHSEKSGCEIKNPLGLRQRADLKGVIVEAFRGSCSTDQSYKFLHIDRLHRAMRWHRQGLAILPDEYAVAAALISPVQVVLARCMCRAAAMHARCTTGSVRAIGCRQRCTAGCRAGGIGDGSCNRRFGSGLPRFALQSACRAFGWNEH